MPSKAAIAVDRATPKAGFGLTAGAWFAVLFLNLPILALRIAEADLRYLRALRDAVASARDDRRRARAAALAVPLPRPAPDDLAGMHAGNVEAQLEEDATSEG